MQRILLTAHTIYLLCAVSLNKSSCSIIVPIAASVAVSLFTGVLMYVAGLLSGVCLSKRRFKASTDARQLLPVPESSTKTEAVYEEVDLHQVKPTDIQLTENSAYGGFN